MGLREPVSATTRMAPTGLIPELLCGRRMVKPVIVDAPMRASVTPAMTTGLMREPTVKPVLSTRCCDQLGPQRPTVCRLSGSFTAYRHAVARHPASNESKIRCVGAY